VPFLYGPRPKLLTLGSTTPYRHILADVRRDARAALFGFTAFVAWVLARVAVSLMQYLRA
jgi:hypothetical protein